MTFDRKETRIPIRFADADQDNYIDEELAEPAENAEAQTEAADDDNVDPNSNRAGASPTGRMQTGDLEESARAFAGDDRAGPVFAELIATRAELKRVQGEVNDWKDKFARRQADFENFRKRVERERSETYNRAVADLVAKLLPVLDNLRRALDTESSVEASESDEFRHFLSGVDLIYKQLSGVLETLGVKPVPAVGEVFDPHVHEAVVTEETDEYEPDTIMQEIVRGYRLGDKLLRPALVKVAVAR